MGPFWRTVVLLFFIFSNSASSGTNDVKTFIVSIENSMKPSEYPEVEQWYSSILTDIRPNSLVPIHHIYKTVFEGFSAELTPQQAQELEIRPEILQVFPEHIYQLQTTRSPEFLGLQAGLGNSLSIASEYGANVIIGLLDTGIWPELPSFNDEGLGPIPSQWQGDCQGGEGFPKSLCNKKLIGTRYFTTHITGSDTNTSRDFRGHGTHTASTVAGRQVNNASFLGTFARGTAVGIAPKARIAMYKICSEDGCFGADVLAGFDKAVEDGVNVISASLGRYAPVLYDFDVIAIGSFGAMEKGVIVTASAGNYGHLDARVCNVAPWMITVGASTIDRKFPAHILLEGGGIIDGRSLFNGPEFPENEYWPLIYAGNASLNDSREDSAYCAPHSLDKELVRGKIVVCDSGELSSPEKGLVVKEYGGIGVIVADKKWMGSKSYAYWTPGLSISEPARRLLFYYMSSSPNPRATMVFRGTQVSVKPAPVVSYFSSRGPNRVSIYVMKPDVIAPGVDILAGWSKIAPPSRSPQDTRRTEFNILSGTSMSCPHVSGIAALLKGLHHDWSPAMIRSAIMTTAYTHDQDGNQLLAEPLYSISNAWDMGSGHVNPEKAQDPGLVYDMTPDDYVAFLCASNLPYEKIKVITRRSVECRNINFGNPWDINYPAISVAFNASNSKTIDKVVVKRTVTHVDDQMSNYTVKVNNPKGVKITAVDPPELIFKNKGEKLSYVVRIMAKKQTPQDSNLFKSEYGTLIWTDGKHQVTTPLVVTWY